MMYNSILIISYGRTGTTLLMDILNSIDGYKITGENYLFVYHLYRSYLALKNTNNISENNVLSPWNNEKIDLEKYKMLLSGLIRDTLVNQDVKCYGFKEIRYVDFIDDLPELLEFMNDVFYNPLFIFNTRNIEDVLKSGFWASGHKGGEANARKLIEKAEDIFKKYNCGNSIFVTYEDIINKTDNFFEMFKKLEVEYDLNNINGILTKIHSGGHAGMEKEKAEKFKNRG